VIKIIILKIGANRRIQIQRSSKLKTKLPGRTALRFLRRLFSLGFVLLANASAAPSNINGGLQNECLSPASTTSYDRLVIIIDDMGNNLSRGKDALDLPGKLNYAVIPYTPHGKKLAHDAVAAGKEVLLHAPMSTQDHVPLGRGGLTPELSREEFRTELIASLEQFPQIVGINNHMGSELTQRRPQMAWIMQELRSRDLYFVDSRTSQRSVAAKVASEFNVPHLSRHVFLDNERNTEAIDFRFQELVARAKKRGIAVAIGHPYQVTIDYLREALPKLEEQGIELALVSEALIPQAVNELVAVQAASTLRAEKSDITSSEAAAAMPLEESVVQNCLAEQTLAENEATPGAGQFDGT
jgi:polysaccharide deacetylase 2 family uncharacterized protein YibQ